MSLIAYNAPAHHQRNLGRSDYPAVTIRSDGSFALIGGAAELVAADSDYLRVLLDRERGLVVMARSGPEPGTVRLSTTASSVRKFSGRTLLAALDRETRPNESVRMPVGRVTDPEILRECAGLTEPIYGFYLNNGENGVDDAS